MKVYLAAYEMQKTNYDVELDKTQNLFLTYFYLSRTDIALPQLKVNGHTGLITIDSGAHSFFEQKGLSVTGNTSKQTKKTESPDEYFAKYLSWVIKNYKYFDYFVELDLQEIVGEAKVNEWRALYKEHGVFDKCITVHHSCNSMEQFGELLNNSESKYIGIEGLRPGAPMLPYKRLLKIAYDRKIKVHGFAFTRCPLLAQFPFYSVDSSSWTMVVRYGAFQKFNNGSMKTVNCKRQDHFFKHNIPIEMHSTIRRETKEGREDKIKLEYTAKEYIKMQTYFTKLWESRGIKWQY